MLCVSSFRMRSYLLVLLLFVAATKVNSLKSKLKRGTSLQENSETFRSKSDKMFVSVKTVSDVTKNASFRPLHTTIVQGFEPVQTVLETEVTCKHISSKMVAASIVSSSHHCFTAEQLQTHAGNALGNVARLRANGYLARQLEQRKLRIARNKKKSEKKKEKILKLKSFHHYDKKHEMFDLINGSFSSRLCVLIMMLFLVSTFRL